MLSLTDGRKIARIKGGKFDKQFLYIKDTTDSTEKVMTKPKDILSLLDSDFFRKLYLKLPDKAILKKAIREGKKPEQEHLIEAYDDAQKTIERKLKTEFFIKDGTLQQLPNKDIVEKIYVSGSSGVGKTTFLSNWLAEAVKIFKDDEIVLFSSVDVDEQLDKYDPERIELDDDFINDPIIPDELENSIVIFDDVDTLHNPLIRKAVSDLRDLILEVGRHYNTRVLMTSHLLTDYKNTRRILNESHCIVVFLKTGADFTIKKFLKYNMGFNSKTIKKIMNLQSRWVSIYKTFPMHIIYEHGVFLPEYNEE